MPPEYKVNKTYKKSEAEMNKAAENGTYSNKFGSYIADGAAGLQDRIVGGVQRVDVVQKVRLNLLKQMNDANEVSRQAAEAKKHEHFQLSEQIKTALAAAREASIEKKMLDAQLMEEESKRNEAKAQNAEEGLSAILSGMPMGMIIEETNAIEEEENGNATANAQAQAQGAVNAQAPVQAAANVHAAAPAAPPDENDLMEQARRRYVRKVILARRAAQNNANREHGSVLGKLGRALSKKRARDEIKEKQQAQSEILERQQRVVAEKSRSWNALRRKYELETYKRQSAAFDEAASTYYMLNRTAENRVRTADLQMLVNLKNIHEYVGEFDEARLGAKLAELPANPFTTIDSYVVNKRQVAKQIGDGSLTKTHNRIALLGEENEAGERSRFKIKLNDGNLVGYLAARQFERGSKDPTALTARNRELGADAAALNLEEAGLDIEARDAGNKYITSQDNIEIIQARKKKDRWYHHANAEQNGVFINGRFVLADENVVADQSKYESSTFRWEKLKQKEDIRRAVLKAQVFRHVNSRTIQDYAGYGADGSADELGLAEFAKYLCGANATQDQIDAKVNELKAADGIYGSNYARSLKDNKDPGRVFPNAAVNNVLSILNGSDLDAREKLPSKVKAKAAFDLIRFNHSDAHDLRPNLRAEGTLVGNVMNSLREDRQALKDLATMLLSDESMPAYWEMAQEICEKMLEGRFTNTIKRARVESGQMLRMALLDELNADRSRVKLSTLFSLSDKSIAWMQYKEDAQAMRGVKAYFKRKVTDMSIVPAISTLMGGFMDTVAATGDAFGRTGKIISAYNGLISYAVDMGAITNVAAYAIDDVKHKDMYDGELNKDNEMKYASDERKSQITTIYYLIANIISAVNAVITFCKDYSARKKEKKQNDGHSFDDRDRLVNMKHYLWGFISQATWLGGAIASGIMSTFFDPNKGQSVIPDLIVNSVNTFSEFIKSISSWCKVSALKGATEDFKSAMQVDEDALNLANPEDLLKKQKADALKDNSQLMWGLSFARKKARDDRLHSGIGAFFNGIKVGISVVKGFLPPVADKIFYKIGAAITGSVKFVSTTIIDAVRTCRQNGRTISDMLGKKYVTADVHLLNSVLRREAGIESTDYLTDLARIFSAVDTHVFMKTAANEGEKQVGSQLAQTLFNNANFTGDKLNKVKVSQLMNAYGVEGNFRKILKYSLHKKKSA